MSNDERQAVLDDMGIKVVSVFIPWSQSRGFKDRANVSQRTLNWQIVLVVKGKTLCTQEYSSGLAYCPSYPAYCREPRNSDLQSLIVAETETGYAWREIKPIAGFARTRSAPILPNTLDVVCRLLLDASDIDHDTFESWAEDLGYDVDSRSAEATYRACLEIGLALRNGLGESGLARLREAFQDY